jgi:hypothetical protein
MHQLKGFQMSFKEKYLTVNIYLLALILHIICGNLQPNLFLF